MHKLCFWLVPLFFLGTGPSARPAEPFTLAESDRVVFLGNTLIEREQRYGYWETALIRHYPGRKIQFRNLGWSGDTVFGLARARFGSAADGFKHLKEHVLALNPTVIILGYGTNESFEGPAGLPHFVEGCKTLLNALAPARARIVWLSPLRQEKLSPPLPEPTEQNKNLRLYADAIKELAQKQDQLFIDLYKLLGPEGEFKSPVPLTDNGIHLTAHGYWQSAFALERGLGWSEPAWLVDLKADGTIVSARGTQVKLADGKGLRFQTTDALLPVPPCPEKDAKPLSGTARMLRIQGLTPGKHTLSIDDKLIVTADAADWARGVSLTRGPELEQVELLRTTILAKNRLYFHRWRPQNETYLFGFRQKEQGQNAVEIPQFDPLVAKQEEEIVKLSIPQPHTYEIKPGANR